jgi:hypothetical protein
METAQDFLALSQKKKPRERRAEPGLSSEGEETSLPEKTNPVRTRRN